MNPDGRAARLVHKVSATPTFAKVAPRVITPLDKAVHRLTGGRVRLSEGMLRTMILTTTGARSGQPRRVPIACFPDGEVLYVVASNFGRERHPAWSTNLLKHPRATAELGRDAFEVEAHLLDAGEKAAVWPMLTAQWPNFDVYADRSGRDLRVFRLERA